MRKIVLTICLFIYIHNSGESQTYQFQAYAIYTLDGSTMYKENFTVSRRFQIDENTYHEDYVNREFYYYKTYTPKVGAELFIIRKMNLSKKFKINLGIGLNYIDFEVNENLNFTFDTHVISSDTVVVKEEETGIINRLCDIYNNNYSSLNIKDEVAINVVNLKIPLNFEYSVLSKLNLSIGAYLLTPLFSTIRSELGRFNRYEDGGFFICYYNKHEKVDRSGNFLSNFNLGYSFGIDYELVKNINISAGFDKQIHNMFVRDDYQTDPVKQEWFSPKQFKFGLQYSF